MKRLFPVLCLFSCLIAAHSFAGSATWTSNPTSGDWYTATNWTPATVPNGPSDIATFANSSVNNVTVSATTTEVAEIVFDAAATSSFNLNIGAGQTFTISGVGVVNDSGLNQNFFVGVNDASTDTLLKFQNTATAGTSDVTYTADSADVFDYNEVFFYGNSTAGSANFVAYGANHGVDAGGGLFNFYENSTAGNANFTINGATTKNSYGGSAGFADFATAGNATFVLNPGTKDDFDGGHMGFRGNATAGDAVFTLNGATASGSETAISFTDAATAGNGFFTVMGGHKSGGIGGDMYFYVTDDELIPTAGNATIIVEGGTVTGASGGTLRFNEASTAGQALIVAHGGENGGAAGRISFFSESDGGEAQIEVYDDGFLDIRNRSTPSLTIGSLAGDGLVHLGGHSLIVGSNNLDTTFSGTIDGGIAGLTKIGSGTLTLSGANTYTGTTTVSAGVLRIGNKAGSATGTGAVNVNAGTVGGNGTVTGPTTVGTGSGAGAFLQPGVGASKPTTLTVQGLLTFKSDGSYTYKLNTNKAKADQVLANGVLIELGALFDLNTVANKKLTIGKVFTAISNTAAAPISGTFANLADGSTFTVGRNKFQTSYSGGDGNDLTLTVVE